MKAIQTISFILTIICIYVAILFSLFFSAADVDYTTAYMLHKEISKFDSCEDALEYLNEEQINYKLADNVVSIHLYDENINLKYTIEGNKLIAPDELAKLSKLDDASHPEMVYENYMIDNTYTTKISFKDSGCEYTKIGDVYQIKFTSTFQTIVLVSLIAGVIFGSILITSTVIIKKNER